MTDFIDLNLSLLGWPHTAACLVAMAAFFPLIFIRKGSARHRAWGKVYAIAYAIACITGLGIYRQHKFFFPHWLAIAGLVVLAVGYFAARYKPRGWRVIHLTAMLLSAENLFGGAVNEAFLRIKPLHAIAGDNILVSPIVGITQAVVGNLFIILIVLFIGTLDLAEWKRYPRAAKIPATARPDYGIDAPVVVRNQGLAGVIGASLRILVTLLISVKAVHVPQVILVLTGIGFNVSVLCTLLGVWMLWERLSTARGIPLNGVRSLICGQ